jgi:hypothetical protein
LHNEKLHISYSSPNIIRQIKSRRMRWVGHVAHMGEERKLYKVLLGKSEGKRPGIRMDLRENSCRSVEWIHLAQGPVEGSCEYSEEPAGSGATELVS